MKKTFPYVLLGIILASLATLMFVNNRLSQGVPDLRISLRKKDKIPYGTYVAFNSLRHIFPLADIAVNKQAPYMWDSLAANKNNQAILIVAPRFYANNEEMQRLIEFAQKGNNVFISVRELSITAQDMMKLKCSISFGPFEASDSLTVGLRKPPFGVSKDYIYPGKKFDTYIYKFDSTITTVLGTNPDGDPDFIRLRTGKGNIYLHLAPLAFSNYFLLHKKNMEYYERILSLIPSSTERVVWDEYYYYKFREDKEEKKGWLSVLMKYDSFRAAIWTMIGLLLVYVLLEMRRKQRIIPVIEKPQNDSLEFVKTIGRLYFDKKDHKNLCKKMASYFLEHVRNRYKLSTGTLDDNFIKVLHHKSGYDEKELKHIVSFINFADTAPAISDRQLSEFYNQLEEFYKKE